MNQLILVPSKSRYELEIEKYGSEAVASRRYAARERWRDIKEGHDTQKRNLDYLVRRLENDIFIDRSELTDEVIRNNGTFVFVGGDNHFTYCSQIILHYLQTHTDEDKSVVGVVLDANRSSGALLNYDVNSFLSSVDRIRKGTITKEQWTTLEATVNNGSNRLVTPAVCDYFVGEYSNLFMSRNDIFKAEISGKVLPEKSSGILVVTGAGSSPGSWYDNIHQCYFSTPDHFARDEESAKIILRENKSKAKTTLQKGKVLIIDSYNDTRGIIAPDSHEDHSIPFEMGARLEIRISNLKLKVVRP